MKKTLLRGGSLVEADGLRKADVLLSVTGEIEQIGDIANHKDAEVIDVPGHLLFPLLIDCHVHFREPGLEHKATMESESAAALAGGVGCVCEMPNTIPPTVTVTALADKVRRASKVDGCEIKFFFGVTEAIHLQALRDLWTGTSMELKKPIGIVTNNIAEYQALIAGLKIAKEYCPNHLICHLDSELVVKQLSGEYRVKMQSFQPLIEEITELKSHFPNISFVYIPREQNMKADALVNKALDELKVKSF